MKRIVFLAFIACFFVVKVNAQAPKAQWVTIKSPNLRCYDCKVLLEQYLKRVNASQMEMGMIQWRINLMQGEIKVQLWPDRTKPNFIKTSMVNAGFDADEMKAEPDSYKLLPPICKRKEDGGGPQKSKPCHMPPND